MKKIMTGGAVLLISASPLIAGGIERAGRYLRKFYPWYVDRMGGGKELHAALQQTATVENARAVLRAVVDANLVRPVRAALARAQGEARHRADRGQRFAAKAERGDVFQIGERSDFGRRVAGQREWQLVGCNAAAVVGNGDAFDPAFLGAR